MEILRTRELNQLDSFRLSDLIKVVTGIRRCGKSTLLRQYRRRLLANGVASRSILDFNFEDPTVSAGKTWLDLYEDISLQTKDKRRKFYVFLDEPQNIEDFERLLDGLYIQPNVNLFVTGSNADMLSSDLATLLSGRYVELNLLPFSFQEYCEAMKIDVSNRLLNWEQVLRDYLYSTAFPAGVELSRNGTANSAMYVRSLYDSILEKDIRRRHDIRDMRAFENIFKFIAAHIGSEVSAGSISKALKQDGKTVHNQTVEKYLGYLSEAFILYKASRFDIKGKEQLATLEKYYLTDLGFRGVLFGAGAGRNEGHLLENVVYLELIRRGWQVWVGKAGAREVDFVARNAAGRIEYFQVSWSLKNQETFQRELMSLRSIRDNYPKTILTADVGRSMVDGIEVANVAEWLLEDFS
jgi:predicted AAA+ superfamily ATPase